MTIDTALETGNRARVEAMPAHGVWVPALTPVKESLEPDTTRYLDHVHWLLANGCHGIAMFGTTSEANSFSVKERMRVLESALEAGLAPRRVMVGTGCSAITDSVRLTRHAIECGCDKVLVLPPFYYKGVSDEGLFTSYALIIEAVADPKLRIFLYHFPKMSAVPITVSLIERLRGEFGEVVAGVKDSSGDWSHTAALIERFPGMAIFPGSERLLLDGLQAGGAGCITATANANPAAIRGVFDHWCDDSQDVAALQAEVTATRRIFDAHPLVPALKYVVAHGRDDQDWNAVRPPLVAYDDTKGEPLIAELSRQGFRFDGAS